MYNVLKYSHLGLMFAVVILMIISVIISAKKYAIKGENSTDYYGDFYNITKWTLYVQALLGAVLIWLSPYIDYNTDFLKFDLARFFGLEHPLLMLIAIGFIVVGTYKTKKQNLIIQKNISILIYYSIALLIMLITIPWGVAFSHF